MRSILARSPGSNYYVGRTIGSKTSVEPTGKEIENGIDTGRQQPDYGGGNCPSQ